MTIIKFILAMFLSFIPGFIGVMFTPIIGGENLWYNSLQHSMLTPDGWVFSVAWSVLYILIGLAFFFVIKKHNFVPTRDRAVAYSLFGLNLILNALWSYVFFGTNMIKVAVIVLTALLVVAIFMSRAFNKISKPAFWLVVPYILWLTFALYLNSTIIYLN
ncbi:MAG: tryptophan-rich sensory protein [Alphaproteobacteria bacterium]|nr:tryptophan-rich sensory protein [Alphaproteobacteria bacterium]